MGGSSAWLLFAVLLGIGEAGHLYPGLGRQLTVLAAAGYLWTLAPRDPRPATARIAAALTLLAGGVLLARMGEPGVVAGLATLPAAILLLGPGRAPTLAARSHLLALAGFALFLALYRHGGAFWHGLERLALGYSQAVGRTVGESYLLSATAIALPGFALAALFVVARAALRGTGAGAWAMRAVGLLLLAHALALALLQPIALLAQRWWVPLEFLLFHPQLWILACLAAGLALAGRGAPRPAGEPSVAGLRGLLRPLPTLAALVGGLGVAFALAWSPPARPAAGRVLLHDRGLDWRVPTFGRYGQRSGGMFGLLPRMLTAWGWEPVVSRDSLFADHLAGFRCVVLINLNESLSAREIADLRAYVERGGSLLVLGDHTGVMGIRGPYNELLAPYGIRFEFDSASFPADGWEYAHAPLPNPLRAALRHDDELQVWVGASLGIDPPARPVVLARYGFSDWGDPAAYELSFLGDRKFNPGERLGDLVLAAECRSGRGRVLVFGDTSPFQTGALIKSQRPVQRIFHELIGTPRPWPRAASLALALAGLALVAIGLAGARTGAAGPWLAIPLGVALGTALALLPHRRLALPPPRADLALIDRSHVPRFDTLSWYDDCIGGLEYNLLRNAFLPRWVEGGLIGELERAALLVVIAPARRFARDEVAAVRAFVERGGWLLLTVGWEERAGSADLLGAFGMDVGGSPLTQFETTVAGRPVRFHEGWPLRLEPASAETLATQHGLPVAALRRVGQGGVVLVGDSWFLLNRNLEGETTAYEGNILFLRDLLARIPTGASPP